MKNIDQLFNALQQSTFRSRFKLNPKDAAYLKKNGLSTILDHAEQFIQKRLTPAHMPNDGKQTPMHGHPVFVAQHATATCCRECLQKWHGIQVNNTLSLDEQAYIAVVIEHWLNQQNEIKTSM